MHSWIRYSTFLVASSFILTVHASAVFPDVPQGHMYQESVEQLVNAGVVNGNPDGNFYPDRAVNRAEMLKMLYVAKGLQADESSRNCFSDVEGWYELYVCDAAARRFVAGYSDGTFRPGNEVNRVEALKMIQEVFGLTVDEISESDREIVQFVDISVAAWYTKYLVNAYEVGILPIAGQDPSRFYPDAPLKRGEATAMIYNGLYAQLQEIREEAEQEEEEEAEEEGVSSSAASSDGREEESEQNDEPEVNNILNTTFPMDLSGKFNDKDPFVYRFDIDQSTVVSTEVSLQSGQPGDVSCILYLLNESGFSSEFYIGVQSDGKCSLLTTLTPGPYQLQIQPTDANTTYRVESEEVSGDGNDGYSEAKQLYIGAPRTETLPQGNLQNWYTFRINNPNGIRLKLDLTNSTNVGCVIYAMDDVDLYGFSGPECGQYYTYPEGTYYVAVTRKLKHGTQQTYTILLGN